MFKMLPETGIRGFAAGLPDPGPGRFAEIATFFEQKTTSFPRGNEYLADN